MTTTMRLKSSSRYLLAGLTAAWSAGSLFAQAPAPAPAPNAPATAAPAPAGRGGANANADHDDMMKQLGITKLRPGKSGNNQVGPGFELATANPWKDTMPELLKMKNGTMVTRADQWPARRAEIVEDFEREVYGRIPAGVPKVTWEVVSTTEGNTNGVATVTKVLTGHVDNSAFPSLAVNIRASVTIPAKATGPVPVFMSFGGVQQPGAAGGRGGRGRAGGAPAAALPTIDAMKTALTLTDAQVAAITPLLDEFAKAQQGPAEGQANAADQRFTLGEKIAATLTDAQKPQLTQFFRPRPVTYPSIAQVAISHGWGYGSIDPASIQADGGGMALRQGIIGLVNKGEPRKPDQWGALRAWQWGVSRLIDYFEANPSAGVNPRGVSIEGVSRYGKAALVAMAFEPRLGAALVASSGEGGAKLHRHDYGEAVENLTAGEYYWMAGNFLKYGAAEPFKKDAGDIPVDSHELIALCAPRPCFISYGVPVNPTVGIPDPAWVDAPGSYMATILASPAYELLGKKGLGVKPADYITAPMPAVKQLVGGELAWRQQEGGHTSAPNIAPFFDWIAAYIKAPAVPQ